MLILGCVLALVLAEVTLRLVLPSDSFLVGREWTLWREHSDIVKRAFVADAELGYVPRLSTKDYDRYGALLIGSSEQPLDKRPGARRILFLGDSVTARRKIVDALRNRAGTAGLEYWVCAVEGYNTYQEVGYYLRYADPIQPDHVVLTLHFNDYESTPAAFYDEEGRIALFTPDRPSIGLNPWLYRYSYVYRFGFNWRVSQGGRHNEEDGARSIRENLVRLRSHLRKSGVELTVLVLPPCDNEPQGDLCQERHRTSLAILQSLGMRHYDLADGIAAAAKRGADVQESPGDRQHPSTAAAKSIADALLEQGFRL